MASEPVDILISARSDHPLAGRWPLRLRTMGVTVADSGVLTDCRALLICLSRADEDEGDRLELLRVARAMRVPTVIVLAEALNLSPEDQPLLAGIPTIAAHRLSDLEAWKQILQALHAQQAILSDPNEKPPLLDEGNQFRQLQESSSEWRTAALATIAVALACLGWWVFLKRDQQERLRDQLGHPLLPAQLQPTPKAIPITPPKVPTGEAASATPPGVHTVRDEQAIALVEACVLAGNRDEGFTAEKIDEIASVFSDPLLVVGKGEQSATAVKASLTARQAEWPTWHEKVVFIKVDDAPTPNDATVVVVVRSSFDAHNSARNTRTSGSAVTRFTVVFDAENKARISQIDAASLP
jgi:hypothetical protein